MLHSKLSICYRGILAGLEDEQGHIVVPCEYNHILNFDDDGYIRLIKGDVYCTVDIEGRPMISPERGLTRLGVFYHGSARALGPDGWGLVDPHGEALTDMDYQSIGLHRTGGYRAVDRDGRKGMLSETGVFTLNRRQQSRTPEQDEALSRPYARVGRFVDDIAPAETHDGRWVFVDRNLNRVNSYSYYQLDKACRQGVYDVMTRWTRKTTIEGIPCEESHFLYGIAGTDGRLLSGRWYSHPVSFDRSTDLAVVDAEVRNPDGSEARRTPEGGRQTLYGIINRRGEFVHPMEFTTICPNDPDRHDCWYAENDRAAFLLYANGRRTILRKTAADDSHRHIENYWPSDIISEQDYADPGRPYITAWADARTYDHDALGRDIREYIASNISNFTAYHCDSDLPAPYAENDSFVRPGRRVALSRKLHRPLCRTRYTVLALPLPEAEASAGPEYILPANACLQRAFSCSRANVTLELLIELPTGIAEAIERTDPDYNFKNNDSLCCSMEYYNLLTRSEKEFDRQLAEPVHSHSLNPAWREAMRPPLEAHGPSPKILDLEYTYARRFADSDALWAAPRFKPTQHRVILIVGRADKSGADTVVEFAASPEKQWEHALRADSKPKVLTIFTPTTLTEADLGRAYALAVTSAAELNLTDIVLTAYCPDGIDRRIATTAALRAIAHNIRAFGHNITICCRNQQEAYPWRRAMYYEYRYNK